MSEQMYTELYEEKMADSRHMYRGVWDRLSAHSHSAYACYCPEGVFCHRRLFVQHAKSYLESLGWTVALMGELSKTNPPPRIT